jgi:hypothetical protein
MANDTTSCAAACPQGSGTAEDTAAYASCQQSCYSSLFFHGTTTAPPATGSGATATATATDAATATATGTKGGNNGTRTLSGSKCYLSKR